MRLKVLLACVVLLLAALPGRAGAGFDLGISVGDGGVKGFYLAVGDYFDVPQTGIAVIKKKGLADDEVPVALFLSARAGVAPSTIVALRLGGMSWLDVTIKYGFTPEVFYMPVKAGPPYGKAYGHYMGRPRGQWRNLRLSDAEVVNLVNLRFISGHYGVSASEVIKMRENGHGFVRINGSVKSAKGGKQGAGRGPGKAPKKGKRK